MNKKDFFEKVENQIKYELFLDILLYLVLSKKKDEEIVARYPIKIGKQQGFSTITAGEEKKRLRKRISDNWLTLKELKEIKKEFLKLDIEKFVERLKEEEKGK